LLARRRGTTPTDAVLESVRGDRSSRETPKRYAVVIAFTVAASSVAPRSASAKFYPWCAYYDAWAYSCGFTTLQQCLATISGAGGACRPNPYPAPDAQRRRPKQMRQGY
jgi:hypothetical protein